MVQEITVRNKIRPGMLAAIFSVMLALPAIGMFIGGLIVGKVGLAFIGQAVFLAITGLYFVAADVVFWNSEETRIR
jgi:hypothetical protein